MCHIYMCVYLYIKYERVVRRRGHLASCFLGTLPLCSTSPLRDAGIPNCCAIVSVHVGAVAYEANSGLLITRGKKFCLCFGRHFDPRTSLSLMKYGDNNRSDESRREADSFVTS